MGLGSSFGISSETNNNIQTDGLISYWDAAYKSSYPRSGTAWIDLAGSNNGTFSSTPTWNSSGYFDFDGYRSTHGTDSSLDLTSAITMNSWINADATDNWRCWLGKGSNQTYMMFFNPTGPKVRMRIGANLSANAIDSVSNYTTGTWANMCGTYDGTNMKIYINGSLDQTKERVGSIPTATSTNLGIGHDGAGDLIFDGKIAISSIYNRALSAGEVLQNYNAQKQRFGI